MDVIKAMIERQTLVEFKSSNQLKTGMAGLFFFTQSEDGMIKPRKRHLGFYFVHADCQVSFISNRHTKGGVVEDRFENPASFWKEFEKIPRKLITN